MRQKVWDFVVKSTKNFDNSHNHEHAQEVEMLCYQIADSDCEKYDKDLLMCAALLHDVCDYKYKELSISEIELHDFIKSVYPEKASDIIDIINNVGFSKEKAGKLDKKFKNNSSKEKLSDIITYRDIVSDADKILAVGNIGIERCFAYQRMVHPTKSETEIIKHVVDHCKEKLSILYTENYIRTPTGRALAQPGHQIILDFMKKHENI